MCSCLRRPYRRFDDADAFGAEDLVELAAELAVSITDQEPRPDALVIERHHQVARLLGYPMTVGIGGDPSEANASGRKLDEKQNVEALQEERVDGEEVALQDARRLLAKELAPVLLEPPRRRLDTGLFQIRPTASDQLAVPAQKRRRGDEERLPPRLPRQHAAERRQQRPVSLRQLRTRDLTLQHAKLVA